MIFGPDELLELRGRAFEAASEAVKELKSASLSTAFTDLAVMLDRAHALVLREMPAKQLIEQLRTALEEAEGTSGEDEPPPSSQRASKALHALSEGPRDREVRAMEEPAFSIAPRGQIRHCSVCGERQFKKAGGWVCKNGHGGAPSKEELGQT